MMNFGDVMNSSCRQPRPQKPHITINRIGGFAFWDENTPEDWRRAAWEWAQYQYNFRLHHWYMGITLRPIDDVCGGYP